MAAAEYHDPPSSPIRPTLDGEVTSFFEWLGAGVVRMDGRSGAMHGGTPLIQELHYGCDGLNFYLRLDFEAGVESSLPGMQVRIIAGATVLWIRLEKGRAEVVGGAADGTAVAYRKCLEVCLPLLSAGVQPDDVLKLQVSLWNEGLPVDSLPVQGWLECPTADPSD